MYFCSFAPKRFTCWILFSSWLPAITQVEITAKPPVSGYGGFAMTDNYCLGRRLANSQFWKNSVFGQEEHASGFASSLCGTSINYTDIPLLMSLFLFPHVQLNLSFELITLMKWLHSRILCCRSHFLTVRISRLTLHPVIYKKSHQMSVFTLSVVTIFVPQVTAWTVS